MGTALYYVRLHIKLLLHNKKSFILLEPANTNSNFNNKLLKIYR